MRHRLNVAPSDAGICTISSRPGPPTPFNAFVLVISHPSLLSEFLELFINPLQFVPPGLFSGTHDLEMFFFQSFEFVVQLVVPRIQDEDLERQRRRRNDEIGQRNSLCEYWHGWKLVNGRFRSMLRANPCRSRCRLDKIAQSLQNPAAVRGRDRNLPVNEVCVESRGDKDSGFSYIAMPVDEVLPYNSSQIAES